MEEKKIFNMGTMTAEEISVLLEQYLSVQKQLTTQKFDLGNRIILQCADSDSRWKQFIGLDAAMTIELSVTGNTLTVTIGNTKWLDKVGAAAVGALFFSPLVVVAGLGAVRQAVLPTEVFAFIENRLGPSKQDLFSGIKSFVSPETFSKPAEDTCICPCCGCEVLKSHAFCSKCGTKL